VNAQANCQVNNRRQLKIPLSILVFLDITGIHITLSRHSAERKFPFLSQSSQALSELNQHLMFVFWFHSASSGEDARNAEKYRGSLHPRYLLLSIFDQVRGTRARTFELSGATAQRWPVFASK
jgi:hypothetical protein